MQFERYRELKILVVASIFSVCSGIVTGCGARPDTSVLGTFRMGEKIQVGPLLYTILESEWKNALTEDHKGPAPQNRYLFVRLSCRNTGSSSATIPTMELQGSDQKTYVELTQGLSELPNWLGVLRTVQPGQTDQGRIVFDAPIGAYKLMISDGGENGSEKYAQVELPVHLE